MALLVDSDFLTERLRELSPLVEAETNPWAGAPNERIQRLNVFGKGRLGVDLFLSVFGGEDVSHRFDGKATSDYSHDIDLDDMRIEAKLACYSPSARNFHFSALRPTTDFTHAWFVCVDFDCVKAFFPPKSAIRLMGRKRNQVTIARYKTPRWLVGYEVGGEGSGRLLPNSLRNNPILLRR